MSAAVLISVTPIGRNGLAPVRTGRSLPGDKIPQQVDLFSPPHPIRDQSLKRSAGTRLLYEFIENRRGGNLVRSNGDDSADRAGMGWAGALIPDMRKLYVAMHANERHRKQSSMSGNIGDKARFNRLRKQKLLKRRTKLAVAAARLATSAPVAEEKKST